MVLEPLHTTFQHLLNKSLPLCLLIRHFQQSGTLEQEPGVIHFFLNILEIALEKPLVLHCTSCICQSSCCQSDGIRELSSQHRLAEKTRPLLSHLTVILFYNLFAVEPWNNYLTFLRFCLTICETKLNKSSLIFSIHIFQVRS